MSKYDAYVCVARAVWVETIGQYSRHLHGIRCGDGEEAKAIRTKEEAGEEYAVDLSGWRLG